jgi:hypothetical protein
VAPARPVAQGGTTLTDSEDVGRKAEMPDEHAAAEPKVDDHLDDLAETTSEAGEHAAPDDAGGHAAPDGAGGHAAPDGAPLHPLIDLSRDPTPGKPDHARPDDE